MSVYRYYSTLRPVGIGTLPNKEHMVGFTNFDQRKDVGNGIRAWGYIEYSHPLTERQAYQYDLTVNE